jgi:hypothetical protein
MECASKYCRYTAIDEHTHCPSCIKASVLEGICDRTGRGFDYFLMAELTEDQITHAVYAMRDYLHRGKL